uniref:Uncharacterized protein n=1 Tax=Rhizophora mucronata TaxID=61149 RepID=A0A2P2PVF4_RHIMU
MKKALKFHIKIIKSSIGSKNSKERAEKVIKLVSIALTF